MTTDQATALDIQREKERQRITNAYVRVFTSEDGKLVLENLKAYFNFGRPVFRRPLPGKSYDTHDAALTDGAHGVIHFIHHKMSSPVKGDADTESPQTTVIK